jgi:phosphoribosylformylglycinamidine cyclo-ligase
MTESAKTDLAAAPDLYREAGVDTDEAEAGLHKLTRRIAATWPAPGALLGGVKLDIGYFANVIDFGGIGVAISTDGIGSKAMIAHQLGKYDTVGIDCVAMNVNDIICVGARPVSMVDYLAIDKIEAAILDQISIGLCDGARQAGISISGGETAQLKDMIHGFDLAGTAIGYVGLDKILIGQAIEEGDVVIGVESNGIHSNGLTLARRTFFELNGFALNHRFDELGATLGEELLRPTHIYVKEAMHALEELASVKAIAHITSDGFLNLVRVKKDVSYVLDALPPVPPIFQLIQRLGEVERSEMFSVFNMGIGLCAVVGAKDADAALKAFFCGGRRAHRIGYVVADGKRNVALPQFGLLGHGKHFKRY